MSEIKEVIMRDGTYWPLAWMQEEEIRTYCENLAHELTTGIAVLKALGEYGLHRFGRSPVAVVPEAPLQQHRPLTSARDRATGQRTAQPAQGAVNSQTDGQSGQLSPTIGPDPADRG